MGADFEQNGYAVVEGFLEAEELTRSLRAGIAIGFILSRRPAHCLARWKRSHVMRALRARHLRSVASMEVVDEVLALCGDHEGETYYERIRCQ